MEIKEINFKTILPYWKLLWPHMQSVSPVSIIDYKGDTNHDLIIYTPTFLGACKGDKIVGVISIVQSSDVLYRIRGIWVLPNERKTNIGSSLIKHCETIANGKSIWSMPRLEALDFYLKNGFKQTTELFYRHEHGPHCFVIKGE